MSRAMPERRRFLLELTAGCTLAAGVRAQTVRRSYAVLSLVGDKLSFVTRIPSTGSSIDRNDRREMAVGDDLFDVAAVRAVRNALQRADPGAQADLFSARDPKLYALQDRLAESDTQAAALAEALRELIAQTGASHLLLVSKFRGEANLRAYDGRVGGGMLTGLGFYVDPHTELRNAETGDTTTGFFAPFAYLRLTLIEAATLRPVRAEVVTGSRIHGVGNRAAQPWQTLNSAEKIAALRGVIDESIDEAVPRLVAAR